MGTVALAQWEARKQAALAHMATDPMLLLIFEIEPEVREIILRTMHQQPGEGYSWRDALEVAQKDLKNLVGWYARDRKIAHSQHYAAVMDVLRDVVPPDPEET